MRLCAYGNLIFCWILLYRDRLERRGYMVLLHKGPAVPAPLREDKAYPDTPLSCGLTAQATGILHATCVTTSSN